MPATVALVGRPNVGKSTLFNRLIGARVSIVEPTPGVTRDRIRGNCRWGGKTFALIDTGGIDRGAKADLSRLIAKQVDRAVDEADLLLFVTDVETGFTETDNEIVQELRRKGNKTPMLLAANKADTLKKEADAAELFRLGLGEPIPISALHGKGIGELLDAICAKLPDSNSSEDVSFRLCMLGRPNVGKSSLVNAMLGEERVVVHETPGTTRDAVDTLLSVEGKTVVLIDTAGLRKRSKVGAQVEYYSRTRSIESLSRSEVALLVLEAPEGVLASDKRIAGEIKEAGKGALIIANKWDKLSRKDKSSFNAFARHVRRELYFMTFAPVLPVSAVTGYGVNRILPAAVNAFNAYRGRLPASEVKRTFEEAVFLLPPPSAGGKRSRFKSMRQVRTSPPTFLLRTNVPPRIPDSYLAYLEGKLRESFELEGTPVRFKVSP